MATIFSFEREMYETLDLVPYTVRRKLDLSGLKLSLEAWRALSSDDRRTLIATEVEDDVAAFVTALQAAVARVGAALSPLSALGDPPWRSASVPPALVAFLGDIHASIDDAAWARLDEEARYVLFKLAEKRRDPDRLRTALVELGLAPASPATPV